SCTGSLRLSSAPGDAQKNKYRQETEQGFHSGKAIEVSEGFQSILRSRRRNAASNVELSRKQRRQICGGCSVRDTPNNPLRAGEAVYTFRPLGASVAQLDRASDYGSEGFRFNS